MEILTSCNTASMATYNPSTNNPWNDLRARHVYNRLAFGAPQAVISEVLTAGPIDLIDDLVTEAITMPNTETPEWGYWIFDDYANYTDQNNEFNQINYRRVSKDIRDKKLKGRLTFFWLNHFVTQIESVNHAPYVFQYWDLLQTHCIGNFKTLTREIGVSAAMLLYLNGFENTNEEPNENYARELYELFTLGQNNGYTQQDIEETSRALTGFNHWDAYGSPIVYNESTFDSSNKVIFGQEGPWGYDDVIDILFDQKASIIANHICTKLYRYFVSPDINQVIIDAMAATFIANDWELEPVFNRLFKSEHFFNEDAIGMVIKSPMDLITIFYNELQFENVGTDDDILGFTVYLSDMLGQNLLQPIDVAGWPGNQDWINSSTLTGRWIGMENLTWQFWNASQEQFRDFARDLTNNSSDSQVITRLIVDYFLSRGLYTETDYEIAESIFRWEIPENYWEEGIWDWNFGSAPYQLIMLLHHIFRMPEFQLK